MFRTIVVHDRGTFLGKRGERLLLRSPIKSRASGDAIAAADGGVEPAPPDTRASEPSTDRPARSAGRRAAAVEEEIPLFRVGEIVLPARGVIISTDLIEEAAMRGIPVTFLGAGGQPYAMITSPMLTATITTRRAQLRAMDRQEGAALCSAFVAGKLRNQASLLVYFAKAEKAEPERRERDGRYGRDGVWWECGRR